MMMMSGSGSGMGKKMGKRDVAAVLGDKGELPFFPCTTVNILEVKLLLWHSPSWTVMSLSFFIGLYTALRPASHSVKNSSSFVTSG
jgi:hypothetical protein